MESGEPVIVAASSEQRKTTMAPIASGEVKVSIGCFSASSRSSSVATSSPYAAARSFSCCSTSGVSTQPGQIALTVMPSLATSRAATFVAPTTPCLAAT